MTFQDLDQKSFNIPPSNKELNILWKVSSPKKPSVVLVSIQVEKHKILDLNGGRRGEGWGGEGGRMDRHNHNTYLIGLIFSITGVVKNSHHFLTAELGQGVIDKHCSFPLTKDHQCRLQALHTHANSEEFLHQSMDINDDVKPVV